MKKFIGVIGGGYWGKNLVRNFHELGVLHSVCDTDPALLEDLQTKYAGIGTKRSSAELLANPEITAVAVAAPASAHYALAKDILLSGKDLFIEKPLALTVREGEEILSLANKHGRILMVGHLLQYHPAVLKLKDMITAGDLGKVQYVYSNRLNIGKLRTEENILWSFAPHDISALLMLLEDEPIRVTSFGGDYLTAGIYDTTMTSLEFQNGVKGHIFVSWLHPFKEQKLVVVGSRGMAVFDDVSQEKLFFYPHTIAWKDGRIPVAQKADHQVIPFDRAEPLKEELRHFIECINGRKRPRTDGEEGLRVLKVLEAAEQSLAGSAGPISREQKDYAAHASAYIDEGAVIGKGTSIWHFSHVLGGSRIGMHCKIGQNVVIGPNAVIGNNVKVQNNVSVYEGVVLEDNVFCGPSMVFTNVYNPRSEIPRMKELRKTLVRRGATIGANATIICGNTVGRYAFIGAGAVVTRDVPDYGLVAGNPAKRTGWMCRCGVKLPVGRSRLTCPSCGNAYRLHQRTLLPVKESQ